jgi:hypothetical protein
VFSLLTTAWRVLISCFLPRRGSRRVALPAAELQRVAARSPLAGGEPDHDGSDLDEVDALRFGDFSGAAEAERFAALPPIPPDAAEEVDWDELARDLTRRA